MGSGREGGRPAGLLLACGVVVLLSAVAGGAWLALGPNGFGVEDASQARGRTEPAPERATAGARGARTGRSEGAPGGGAVQVTPGGPERPVAREEAAEALTIRDGLPSDVPRHPGAEPVLGRTLPNGDLLAGFSTRDHPADVFEGLQRDLEARGWILDHVLSGHGQRVIRASKGEREVIAMVVEEGESTRIAVRATLD